MPATDRIIEIAETSAFLSLENHLLKIRLPSGPPVTVPVKEVQCLILANPALTITGSQSSVPFELYKPQPPQRVHAYLSESSVPFELYKPQLSKLLPPRTNKSSVPFELYKPQP